MPCGRERRGQVHVDEDPHGDLAPDSGTIEVDGKPVSITTPADAEKFGIAIIHQELNLVDALSIADNIFLGRELQRFGLLNRRR